VVYVPIVKHFTTDRKQKTQDERRN